MEVGGGEDKEIGRPNSLVYNGDSPPSRRFNQPQQPQDLSSPRLIVVTAATTTPTATGSIVRSPTASSSTTTVRYRECLKNHAANMGGHVVDGCGEFMPSGEGSSAESLKCAACECHRNFHRKEVNGEPSSTQYVTTMAAPPSQLPNFAPQQVPHHQLHHRRLPTAPVMMAFGGGGVAESSSEDLNMFQSGGQTSVRQAKKRFRTKFSQEQKDKMTEFADKLGWKIQRQDEQEVQEFCSQVGVKRQVFKVWMHNNKQAMKKKTSVRD
ncbi:putative Homeobox protein 24 [Tripterygium wilfordii]|uniref:Putative Homeobox protein 24 n=1 Tax=Tripterygium wilfordii TaxID=458696 RepID=A0A7J7E304_TRIWF|nr:zinc-finger homeodomain protein 5 [Tripterygium wilfordii]KAF5752985.1 putative Homeobox protein 24 [Tripterygium wilfordii]